MSSKSRKMREQREQEAATALLQKATTIDLANAGGGSGGLGLSRSDLQVLERHARKPRFYITDKDRVETPQEMGNIVRRSKYERNKIAAAKVILAFDLANMKDEELEDQRQRDKKPASSTPVEHSGKVTHEHIHSVDAAAFADFIADVARAGMEPIPENGCPKPIHSLPPPS